MDFSAREDIEAPIDFVFEQVTDFATFERSIMRRGGDVERLVGDDRPIVGTKWRVKFRMRGKERLADAELVSVERPNGLAIKINSSNIDGISSIELVALSRARTRLIVDVKVTPKTIPAKLMFQSMRFARQKTVGRFKSLVAGFAEDTEARYRD